MSEDHIDESQLYKLQWFLRYQSALKFTTKMVKLTGSVADSNTHNFYISELKERLFDLFTSLIETEEERLFDLFMDLTETEGEPSSELDLLLNSCSELLDVVIQSANTTATKVSEHLNSQMSVLDSHLSTLERRPLPSDHKKLTRRLRALVSEGTSISNFPGPSEGELVMMQEWTPYFEPWLAWMTNAMALVHDIQNEIEAFLKLAKQGIQMDGALIVGIFQTLFQAIGAFKDLPEAKDAVRSLLKTDHSLPAGIVAPPISLELGFADQMLLGYKKELEALISQFFGQSRAADSVEILAAQKRIAEKMLVILEDLEEFQIDGNIPAGFQYDGIKAIVNKVLSR